LIVKTTNYNDTINKGFLMNVNRQQLTEIAKKEVFKTKIKSILLEQETIPPEQLVPMVQQALEIVVGTQQAAQAIGGAMEGLQAAMEGLQSTPLAQDILLQLMQHFQIEQAQQAQVASQEQKQEKEQNRLETQAEISESLEQNIDNVLGDSLFVENSILQEQDLEVFETEAHFVVGKTVNYEHIFTRIRAIEGVTVVSIQSTAQEIGPSLDRLFLNIKYLKGARPSQYFLSLLKRALLRISGVKSVRFVATRKLGQQEI
jgi:hypothetical protein